MQEWARKKDEVIALLQPRYAKADPPNVGTERFWRGWTQNYISILVGPVSDAVTMGVEVAAMELEATLTIGTDLGLANAEAAAWAREFAAELAQGLTETDTENIREALGRWIESDEDFDSLVSVIDDVVGDLARARLIAVTESTRAYAEGNKIAWRASGVIESMQWNTALDERVCPICEPLNGVVAPLSGSFDGIPNPPAHPSCRCWLAPVV